ncbi:MAG: tRNA (adenosine(37)-N6)-threonylcarbamoyltransferase complex ATPase subunit type 1 TsaE [Chthoniobacteraceae bacterium]
MASTISHKPEKTFAIARTLAPTFGAGDVVALVGDLGAGKTQFAKGLAAGLGFAGEVTSPTFTLLHEYEGGRLPIFHFDFYRIEKPSELFDLGFDAYVEQYGGVTLVEWADKFPELLPARTRWFELRFLEGDQREIIERARDDG